ncbi:DUF3572 domain-containing protein [Aureimonas mangrovi]|uniref:DUF3572 domain-containing protein n=1 Tax=Aureimonas mangrovi TaxID=2758041 RepID=UPI00163DB6EA|nr:DUF3572 domain-containing protein [Aureimonas mangrovi]
MPIRDRHTSDPSAIGIAALSFLAADPVLMRRFLDLSGYQADQLRAEAEKPSFFVALLDFILAHEPTVMQFASFAEIDPAAVGQAREG